MHLLPGASFAQDFSSLCISMLSNSCQVIYCPKEVQIICLSATVANADELAGWISEVTFL